MRRDEHEVVHLVEAQPGLEVGAVGIIVGVDDDEDGMPYYLVEFPDLKTKSGCLWVKATDVE